jgi:hypothetical protein
LLWQDAFHEHDVGVPLGDGGEDGAAVRGPRYAAGDDGAALAEVRYLTQASSLAIVGINSNQKS